MRAKAARLGIGNLYVLDGTLDAIPLPSGTADLLVTCRAIGWDLPAELTEVERILRARRIRPAPHRPARSPAPQGRPAAPRLDRSRLHGRCLSGRRVAPAPLLASVGISRSFSRWRRVLRPEGPRQDTFGPTSQGSHAEHPATPHRRHVTGSERPCDGRYCQAMAPARRRPHRSRQHLGRLALDADDRREGAPTRHPQALGGPGGRHHAGRLRGRVAGTRHRWRRRGRGPPRNRHGAHRRRLHVEPDEDRPGAAAGTHRGARRHPVEDPRGRSHRRAAGPGDAICTARSTKPGNSRNRSGRRPTTSWPPCPPARPSVTATCIRPTS